MNNICIIGNSHTAALKKACDGGLNRKEACYKFNFFAAKSRDLRRITFDSGLNAFVANDTELKSILEFTSGGSGNIQLERYDAFLLVGLTRPYFKRDTYFSAAVIKSSLEDWYSETLGVALGKQIFASTGKRVYLAHSPLKANEKSDTYPSDPGLLGEYVDGVNTANTSYFLQHGLELIPQPTETVNGDGKSTNSYYSKGSKGLSTSEAMIEKIHPQEDDAHMNEVFGELFLRNFISICFSDHL